MPKTTVPDFEMKGEIPGIDVKSPKLDIKSGNVNINGPKVDIDNPNLNVPDNAPNINVEGKLPKIKSPDIDIKGKNDEIIFSGIIKGKKELEKPKIKGMDINLGGNVKGPKVNVPNVEIKKPDLDLDINKEFDINPNIKVTDVKLPTGEVNLKGTNLKGN